MKTIPLTQGKFAQVDDEDHPHLSQWKWYFNGRYAVRVQDEITIYMHREINKTPADKKTDHRDGNGINNQRHNLRDCSNSQNQLNRLAKKTSSSKYKGVSYDKNRDKYQSHISIDGKLKFLGRFDLENEAAKVYNVAALKYHGKFAKLNILIA